MPTHLRAAVGARDQSDRGRRSLRTTTTAAAATITTPAARIHTQTGTPPEAGESAASTGSPDASMPADGGGDADSVGEAEGERGRFCGRPINEVDRTLLRLTHGLYDETEVLKHGAGRRRSVQVDQEVDASDLLHLASIATERGAAALAGALEQAARGQAE